ncbi:MAG: hypothetical protein V2I97_03730 [Desulfococcaceae bacterium]|jgi:hypothetical protein|nr:hypothetical protein [Desulfococcaceae bacterium]
MKARLTLRPVQKGTGKLTRLDGDRLYRVRYRYDEKTKKRFKTVELIAEERPWKKHTENRKDMQQRTAIADPVSPDMTEFLQNRLLSVRIEYGEVELGKLVKAAGGIWNREKRVWVLAHKDVMALGLQDRVVG